jgi:hypothetical protein
MFAVYTILYILEFRHVGKHLWDLPSPRAPALQGRKQY